MNGPKIIVEVGHRDQMYLCVSIVRKCKGHIMSECWELEKKKVKSNAFVNVKRDGDNLVTDQSSATETGDGNEVNPFISEGHVSLTAGADPMPIRILRDIVLHSLYWQKISSPYLILLH